MVRRIPLMIAFLALSSPCSGADRGLLRVTQLTPPKTVDLTVVGTADWCHWGLIKGTTILHRKHGAKSLIGDLIKLGSRETHTFENNITAIGWSNGEPAANVRATNSGLFTYGKDNGFEVKIPAAATVRTAHLYAGVWRATGKLQATLSDSIAPSHTEFADPDPKGEITNVLFTLTYRAATNGESLKLRWTNPGTAGNVEFMAVTLADGEPDLSVRP